MKRDLIEFQNEIPVGSTDNDAASGRFKCDLTKRRISMESLSYGAVMISMFIAILAFMVMIVINL